MANEIWFRLILFFPIFCFLFNFILVKMKNRKNLPPGPRPLPIIGHLHLFRPPVHRILQELSATYGPVMLLRFGYRKVVVISSPEAVEECFAKNDIVFANRPKQLAGKLLSYNYSTIPAASYGDHWRNMRRLVTLELLCSHRLSMLKSIREEEVQFLLKQVYEISSGSKPPVKVELRSKLKDLAFNIIIRMIAGKRYFGKDADSDSRLFLDTIRDSLELVEVSNWEDYFPAFQWLDIQGRKKKMVAINKKKDEFYQKLIDDRRRLPNKEKTTLIDAMLSLQQTEPENYPDLIIKIIIQSLIIAGTDTSASTMEWAMAALLHHAGAKKKLLAEIESCVGEEDRLVDENDLPKLKYLQNVVNETLRLFPPVPLLVPHESSDDCTVSGFHLPKGTILIANMWSIHLDPKLWEDPTKFKPERFFGWENDGYKYLPFGAGRRACPGNTLGKRVVALAVGALLQSFDWEREGKTDIDMTEGNGLTMARKEPLEAICKPRQTMLHLLSQL